MAEPGKAPERKPLVELRELAPKDFVRIFGRTYDLVDLDSLSIRQRAIIGAHFERLLALERAGPDMSDDDETEHTERSEKLIRLVLPTMPDDVIAQIPPGRRGELLGAFLAWATKRNLVMDLMERLASLPKSPTSRPPMVPASG